LLLRKAAVSQQQGKGLIFSLSSLTLGFYPASVSPTGKRQPAVRQRLMQTLGRSEAHLTAQATAAPKPKTGSREQGTGMRRTCRGKPETSIQKKQTQGTHLLSFEGSQLLHRHG